MGYTIDQIEFYGKAIARSDRSNLRDMAIAARMAQLDGKSFGSFIKKLDSDR